MNEGRITKIPMFHLKTTCATIENGVHSARYSMACLMYLRYYITLRHEVDMEQRKKEKSRTDTVITVA
jgi:hypothetical protein